MAKAWHGDSLHPDLPPKPVLFSIEDWDKMWDHSYNPYTSTIAKY